MMKEIENPIKKVIKKILITFIFLIFVIAVIAIADIKNDESYKPEELDNTELSTNSTNEENVNNEDNTIDNIEEELQSDAIINGINMNDYVGMWYENQELEGYSEVDIAVDDNNRIELQIGIYRLNTFDELSTSITGNVIKFNDIYGTTGTVTLEKEKVILEYSSESFEIKNQKIEFTYRKERKTTQITDGLDLTGKWSTQADSDSKGYVTFNPDNTFSSAIKKSEKDIITSGKYKLYGNKIKFITNKGEVLRGEFKNGKINYYFLNEEVAEVYPEQ